MKSWSFFICLCAAIPAGIAQTRLPLIHSGSEKAIIIDGKYVKTDWQFDPNANQDTYYVNVPRADSRVIFRTDQAELKFKTRFGREYNFLVVLNNKDTCHICISAKDGPAVRQAVTGHSYPDTIPFMLKGARVYLAGKLNGDHAVTIQLDFGAGGAIVNKMVSEQLALQFDGKTMTSNTQGLNEARASTHNRLEIGHQQWTNLPFTEVGNMQMGEDVIIGNGLFRDKVIELDYDNKVLIVYNNLPSKAKKYRVQPVYYEQDRPKFEATIMQNNQPFNFWFLFDTGRDGTMLIGKDFTGQSDNWNKLQALMVLPDGRKIVRLDAVISGQKIKDIVTNAADPVNAASRPTLIGNQVLNHFNVILDNPRGLLYLKPNGRWKEPYSNYDDYLKTIKK
ncbi:Aspartyl protease [Mucilaginibacter pineti]|uniref:Aspartyl protease n=1 Tax=Mucilaginibacter pineti TaxID=1391627 RepID=A0A1G7KT82_9SPHI|nr:retropepsin-like aspartic protease [Mucilaginibacter pineti]SDF40140.1 Aspartyl protease [Mucilaginibacter pineti]